jgi:hypothetical protein
MTARFHGDGLPGRFKSEARELALLYGDKTYRGSTHGCGTNERYVKGGACVYCARLKQTEQRDARRQQEQLHREAVAFFNVASDEPEDESKNVVDPLADLM